MTKVSIIIPVYKTAATVAAAIDSALAQRGCEVEVICVDDGSPDGAGAILAGYAAKEARVRVISQENRGLSGARNRGLEAATGEYVTFLDSDDLLPRWALEVMVGAAERSGAPVVVSERPIDAATEEAKRRAMAAERPSASVMKVAATPLRTVLAGRRMRSSAWNKLYRRTAIGSLRFIEGIYFEDWPFVTMLLANVDRVAVVSVPCYVYSKTGDSIIRSSFDEKKVLSYETGIRRVFAALGTTEAWPVARRRCAQAASMMIGGAVRSRVRPLAERAVSVFRALRSEKILRYRDLPCKTILKMLFI